MNKYTLYQGDCLNVLPTIDDESVDLILTDPPYNIGIFSSETINDYLSFMERVIYQLNRVLKRSGSIYIFTSRQTNRMIMLLLDKFFIERRNIIWVRRSGINTGRGRTFTSGYDPICYYTKSNDFTFNVIKIPPERRLLKRRDYKNTFNKFGSNLTDVWNDILFLPHNAMERVGHPTQKPEKLFSRIMEISSCVDDVVLDPFLGSGTTLKVAQDLHRSCIGIEIDPQYIEMTKTRCWKQQFLDRKVIYDFRSSLRKAKVLNKT